MTAETVGLDRHTYEDPFLDMASTKLPKSFKKVLELCQIFAMTHPQIAPIIWRLSEYPITSLVYKGEDESRRQHKDLFENKLRIMERGIEWGLDYYGYGNCFVSVSMPFVRMYECRTCQTMVQSSKIKYQYTGGEFRALCRKCQSERVFKPHDQYVRDPGGIHVFRFEPQLITPKFNRVTGRYFYYYTIPDDLRRSIETGDRDIIDSTPIEYLEAVRLKRNLKLKRVFHFKRPTISGRDMQWGFPLVMPALKDAYLNQIYKKADEAIALEHSVPLRVIYPEPRTQDPMQRLALGNFKNFMARNIRYWRQDKNAIITSPMPIGTTNIGGDAGAYSTIQSRIKVVDEIMGAMMVTRGFVMGGENWSSQSISQRVMENSFINYIRRLDACLQWIRDEVAAFLDLPPCTVSMKPFKKIDDVQMLQLVIQLARENRVSWEEALSRMDMDAREELESIERESSQYIEIMVQQLVAQNEANAKALVAQTVAQDEAAGVQELTQAMVQRSSGVRAEIEGKASKDQVVSDMQQAQENAPPDAQTQALQARADRDEAQAVKDRALAKRHERSLRGGARQQMVDVDMDAQIKFWARELVKMSEPEQRRVLARLHADNPELAAAVVAAAENADQSAPEDRRPAVRASSNAKAMMQALVSEAKNADELAQKLMLIEPRQQTAVLREIQRQNPQLFIKVMRAINAANMSANGAGGGNVVDMRPLPEQKPPRREERPV